MKENAIFFDQTGLKLIPSEKKIKELKSEFKKKQALHLKNFISPSLLSQLQKQILKNKKKRFFSEVETELFLIDKADLSTLQLKLGIIFSNPKLIQLIEAITEKKDIEFTEVAIQRMKKGSHRVDWHCDNNGHRFAALSINLTPDKFEGGNFLIRNERNKKVLARIRNHTAGDAHLFNIGDHVQHRVTSIKQGKGRIFLNIWFGRYNPKSFKTKPTLLLKKNKKTKA